MWVSILSIQRTLSMRPQAQWMSKVQMSKSWIARAKCFSTSTFYYKNEGNIILMGSPGSGKTTHGRKLSKRLGMPVLDVDDHHLEPLWQMKVSEKLNEVGAEKFLEAEGEALLQLKASNTIISLTGSNPLHNKAMQYISESGVVVFIDANSDDIISRLEAMKVDRIVGQGSGMTMKEILTYRQQFYEDNYDVRVTCEKEESFESIGEKISEAVRRFQNKSGYVSTRSQVLGESSADFNQVVLQGLAQDGGLYVPEHPLPSMTIKQWDRLVEMTYEERALRILELLLHPSDLHPRLLKNMINTAYSIENFNCKVVAPVVPLENNQYILELFHGPSASFKDGALQLMPQFFSNASERDFPNTRHLILVATSGDTGSAVLDGFSKYADKNTSVVVLYPERGVSAVQKALMTSATGENIKVIGINSDFDFCQSAIKRIFSDTALKEELLLNHNLKLSAANSINWGRLLPQVVYHASGYLTMVQQGIIGIGDPVDVCIPTGNFGNILGAIYSKQMGIPFRRFVCTSNKNNVLSEFFNTGMYDLRQKKLSVTTSPAIDILKSSNLERYLYMITNKDSKEVRRCFDELSNNKFFQVSQEVVERMQRDTVADWCSEELCSKTIHAVFKRTGYLLDPHTAVAKAVADRFHDESVPMVICSTAHYGKFASDVLTALEGSVDADDPVTLFRQLKDFNPYPMMHLELEESIRRPKMHTQVLSANVNEIISELKHFIKMM
ncbi:threonine synthase-like 1 [Antedon mediterranea]|uniref:threonine synthase-like 1 n=1 Tax=Antedon mediterranea TaxID=105859 RepID=UPI003AF42746